MVLNELICFILEFLDIKYKSNLISMFQEWIFILNKVALPNYFFENHSVFENYKR